MLTEPAAEFSQLTWVIVLTVPAIMALLHVPLIGEWLWRQACGRSRCAA